MLLIFLGTFGLVLFFKQTKKKIYTDLLFHFFIFPPPFLIVLYYFPAFPSVLALIDEA